MIKKGWKKDMNDFLQIPDKLSGKKKKQINKSKRKASIKKTSSRKATINCLDSFDKKELTISFAAIKTSEPKAKDIDIAMINMDAYYVICYLKDV